MNCIPGRRATSSLRSYSQLPRNLTTRSNPPPRTRPFSSTPFRAAYTPTTRTAASSPTTAKPTTASTSSAIPNRLAPRPASSTTTARPAATPPPTTQRFSPVAAEPPPPTARTSALASASKNQPSLTDLSAGLSDAPKPPTDGDLTEPKANTDWTTSYSGLGDARFEQGAVDVLLAPVSEEDVEVKPDGILYLPEIKYRRILNRAFGPGGWGLAPRGESIVTGKLVTREYALVVQGRLVSIARGEQQYFDPEGIPTATEGCKSNALMRCCKDVGIASELWDPRFIRKFLAHYTKEVWVEHQTTKKKRKLVIRKDDVVKYPFKETKM
ncbi:Mgm101p-domain-containing protein [Mytilinidion resinicola]|uniref:Mitochondrial genome maintenance protein MGM101 n=1 Tax=Mytilinidion resinicola TaxID=574789 RepID=A0A6A6Z2D8_9PEZI|nr:Mgm101p-domain-containing protein [Mytilinidion resinicola]KAF2814397.1 Mgm101p-domain-containing protein [Mytilinidion resinicola]